MRILSTRVFLLITAGILGSTVAQRGPTHEEFFQKLSDPEIRAVIEKLSNNFIARCERNGGPTAYDNVKLAVDAFDNCLQPVVAKIQFDVETFQGAESQDLFENFFKKICPVLSTVENCTTHLMEPIESCLKPKVGKIMDLLYKMASWATEFSCQDLGRGFASFLTDDGQKCLISEAPAIAECGNRFSSTYFDFHEAFDGLRIPTFNNREDCNHAIDDYQLCIVEALRRCENQKPAVVMDSLLTFIKGKRICENYYDFSYSSSDRVIETLSITSLMAISLRFV